MPETKISEPRYPDHDINQARDFWLAKLVDRWDPTIKHALVRLAHTLWPPHRLLGLIPVRSYRLCAERIDGLTHMWWIEQAHPFEHHKYAAYGIRLTLDPLGQPVITVQSGDTIYPVPTLTTEALDATLSLARYDTPLVVCRERKRL